MKGLLLPIAAPSGTGKTTVCRTLMDKDDRFLFSVSCTTRAPRVNERDGVDYFFISKDRFIELIKENQFVEWEQVFDNYYGTLRSQVEEALQRGKILLLDIDVKGSLNIKRQYPEQTITIFLLPPSEEEWTRRLRNRGTETEEDIIKRKARYQIELELSKQFDHMIVNDRLEETVATIKKIIEEYYKNDKDNSV